MASALVDGVVEKLARKLMEEISKEVSLVCNFTNDFEWLGKKLRNIRGYLRNADAQNKDVKSWLLDVADIAWDAEDILDECALESKGIHNEISQFSCVCALSYSQLVFRYKMARRIKDVRERMKSIMEDAATLKLVGDLTHPDQPSTSTPHTLNLRGLNIIERDSHPVAIDSKVEDVLHLMNDPAAPVIAIVGMGGVGKTFLMQNVFNRIKDKFEKAIWLSISQTPSLKKLQAALARELDLDRIDDVDEVKAAELIHGRLQSTTFLVVLDDVWSATQQENLMLALGLPSGNNPDSKIVVTTRSKHVSSNMNARVYEVQLLSEEESWTLFSAFAFNGKQPPHHLEGISSEVEGQCGRLPLALKTVAASLANKTLSREWELKLEELKGASSTEDPIMQILRLSYDSLPSHLKPCFVYLSFFPEDSLMDYQYLINLWVAEGYVPEGEEQLDVGWTYICHLHSLCLLERVYFYNDKEDRLFKVHDLVLDLAVSIAKENQSAFSIEEDFKKSVSAEKGRRYRRILMGNKNIGDGDVDIMTRNRAYSASCLRTLSFSYDGEIKSIPAILVNGANVMRVLDLSFTEISSLPDCVGKLKLLTLLNLRGTDISKVPECVKTIKSLRFLDISYCSKLKEFPEWIGKLKCLEHLDIRLFYAKYMPKGISKLVSLKVLKLNSFNRLSMEENVFFKLEHFVNLLNLREVEINIQFGHEAELKSIEDGIIAVLVKMRTLTIVNLCSNESNLSEKILAMKDLEYLYLEKFAVPHWVCGFSNLMQLELRWCHCAEYPALEMMPNLIKLVLFGNFKFKSFPKGFGKSGGFLQLLYFEINYFEVLEVLPKLEDGAMPRLEILKVENCPNLKEVPSGLELLKNLKECSFGRTEVTHMFEEGGELWNKMKAKIRNLKIHTK